MPGKPKPKAKAKGKDDKKGKTEVKMKEKLVVNSEELNLLRTNLRIMKTEILNEKKLLNDFQQQKEKIEQFWLMEKESRDDLTMELRNKLRQKQDLEEKEAFELNVYKQKVKHLLHEIQANMTDVRIEGQTALKLLQDENRGLEHELDKNIRSIKVVKKRMELSHLDLIKNIKQGQEQQIMHLRQEYERRAEELKLMYEKKMKVVREKCFDQRKEDVAMIERRKNQRIYNLMLLHKDKFEDIKEYYRDITRANLDNIKNLKEIVGEMKKKEKELHREVSDISRENKRLSKPLQRNRKLVSELQEDYKTFEKEEKELDQTKASVKLFEEKVKNLSWEHEILLQKYQHLKEERDGIRKKLEHTIYEVQQKTGFKNLLLEKKLEAMKLDVEKTEAALAEVVASMREDTDPEVQHTLEDVLMTKNKTVQKLERRLDEVKENYEQTIVKYEAKLREYNIPVEELGFTPVRRG